MGYPELIALKTRCTDYRAKCRQQHKPPHEHYVTLENAVDFYIDKATHKGIKHAFDQFSSLRQTAQGFGYTVPPLVGNMALDDILGCCAILREAIAAATPLPGESPVFTSEMRAAMEQNLTGAIESINAQYELARPF